MLLKTELKQRMRLICISCKTSYHVRCTLYNNCTHYTLYTLECAIKVSFCIDGYIFSGPLLTKKYNVCIYYISGISKENIKHH